MKTLKNYFKPLTIEQAIQEELYTARHRLLEAQTTLDWSNSEVLYNTSRIKRLEKQQNDMQTQLLSREV